MSARVIGTREFMDSVARTDLKTSAGVTARGSMRISVQTGIDHRCDSGVSDRRMLAFPVGARRSRGPEQKTLQGELASACRSFPERVCQAETVFLRVAP